MIMPTKSLYSEIELFLFLFLFFDWTKESPLVFLECRKALRSPSDHLIFYSNQIDKKASSKNLKPKYEREVKTRAFFQNINHSFVNVLDSGLRRLKDATFGDAHRKILFHSNTKTT